jgi:hypothetical protein
MKTIFVFGSNTRGVHGAGAALYARQNFGAILGQPSGLQNDSYAIITKDLSRGKRSIPLEEIDQGIAGFYSYVSHPLRPPYIYIVSPIGCGLAGYTIDEIKTLFKKYRWPDNVYFHPKFL